MNNITQPLGAPYPKTQVGPDSKTQDRILLESTILFARHGYADVSMKDIAKKCHLKPASLYNHFDGKEALWDAVLAHTEDLYRMYFARLEKARIGVKSFEEALETMFVELLNVVDIFTYYSFSLVQTEQFRDEKAGTLFTQLFLQESIAYIKGRFDECIQKGWVASFDTETLATIFMHSVHMGIDIRVQEHLGRPVPYDVTNMFLALKAFILRKATSDV
ncbi:TetR/AcrR family transcriptional regulator [Christensenellaceae bacterium OttesenSCG-928-L17]|nr:TetR/AcrR family transcriptional regulator [Christensenellaceae bacterium OttesenSCG-928-L17]